MAQAGLVPRKVRGRRYTDEATLAIVVKELRQLAHDIEKTVRRLGGRAVAMAGGSLQCLKASQIALEVPNEPSVDLGRVGRVTQVDVDLLTDLSSGGIMPIISCVGEDPDGGFLNINADEAARFRATADAVAAAIAVDDFAPEELTSRGAANKGEVPSQATAQPQSAAAE